MPLMLCASCRGAGTHLFDAPFAELVRPHLLHNGLAASAHGGQVRDVEHVRIYYVRRVVRSVVPHHPICIHFAWRACSSEHQNGRQQHMVRWSAPHVRCGESGASRIAERSCTSSASLNVTPAASHMLWRVAGALPSQLWLHCAASSPVAGSWLRNWCHNRRHPVLLRSLARRCSDQCKSCESVAHVRGNTHPGVQRLRNVQTKRHC